MPVILGFNHEDVHNAPAHLFNISANSFGFGDPDVLSGTDILVTGRHLTCDPDY